MTFDEINDVLRDSISIEENFHKIDFFFYSMSNAQIKELDIKIEDLYSEIKVSICNLENETLKISILLLFAKFFEKTANRGLIIDVIKLLPETLSIKHRLNAFVKYRGFKDISSDFTKRYIEILFIFSKAIDLEEDEHTEEVIDSVIQYLDFAEEKLSYKFPAEFDRLKELLLSIENSLLYPFLEHGKLLGRLTGREIFDLSVLNYSNTIYSPSNTIDNFFREKIVLPIKDDLRTQWHHKPMGYESSKIRKDILLYGRGDFDEPYEDISCDEKVLLYCYYNLRKHYFSSFSLFCIFR